MLKNVGWDDFRNPGISVNHAGIRIIQAYELNMNNIDQKSFNSWSIQEIKDSDIQIIDGDRGNNYPKKEEFSDSGFCLFLNTGNIKDDKFAFNRCDFISENKDHQLRKGKLQRDDIVLTTRGTVGNLAYYHQGISIENIRINSGMIILRCGVGINSQFLYQLLKSQMMKEQYMLYSSGSAQPQLPIRDFNRIKILLPPLTQQQQIAEILSAYDDLIETNNQRIATLEQLAQQIYKEWFVRMRFPGWETTPFHHGIPEGWEICKLESLCRNLTDGTHDTPKPTSHGHFLVTGKHINRENFIDFSQAYFISETDHKKISNRSGLDEGDIVFSNIGTIGSCAIIKGETDFSVKNVLIFKPKEKYLTTFLFYLLTNSSTLEQLLLSSSGASQQFIGLTFARDFKVLVPKYDLIEQFNALVEPVVEQKYVLNKNNQLLAKTRNLLLPRLISGKLTIKQAEALAT